MADLHAPVPTGRSRTRSPSAVRRRSTPTWSRSGRRRRPGRRSRPRASGTTLPMPRASSEPLTPRPSDIDEHRTEVVGEQGPSEIAPARNESAADAIGTLRRRHAARGEAADADDQAAVGQRRVEELPGGRAARRGASGDMRRRARRIGPWLSRRPASPNAMTTVVSESSAPSGSDHPELGVHAKVPSSMRLHRAPPPGALGSGGHDREPDRSIPGRLRLCDSTGTVRSVGPKAVAKVVSFSAPERLRGWRELAA